MKRYIYKEDRLYTQEPFRGRKEYNDWSSTPPWGNFIPKWMRGKTILVTGWSEKNGHTKVYGKEIELERRTRISKVQRKQHLHIDTGMWTNVRWIDEYLEFEEFKIFIKDYSEYFDTPEENIQEIRQKFEEKKSEFLKEAEEKDPKWRYSVSDLVRFEDNGEIKLDFSMYPKGEANIEYTSFIKKDSALD